MADTGSVPNRVVDRDNYGWYLAAKAGGGFYWTTGHTNSLGSLRFDRYADLASVRGPVRAVLPITGDDHDELRDLFGQAGRKTITTLAAALEDVFHRLREQHCGGNWSKDAHGGWEYAKRTMMAGRAGSDEAQTLIDVTLFGNELNLARGGGARGLADDVALRRAAGPVKRVDKQARDAMAAIIWRWVTGETRYTEIAETLASLVAGYADDQHGPDGWLRIADQWLQPSGLARDAIRACYGLFYSRSEHKDWGHL